MRAVHALFLVLVLLIGTAALPQAKASAAEFRGQVVGAETGEPLEGAVVVVVWDRHPYYPKMDGGYTVYRVVEELSDAAGKFAVDISPGLISFGFHSRHTVIFKPGYHPLTRTAYDKQQVLLDNSAVRLAKIRTMKEARKYTSDSSVGVSACDAVRTIWCTPRDQIANLLRLLEIQRRLFEPKSLSHFITE